MLNIESNLEELMLDSIEYAHLTERKLHTAPEFKVHVPKVMAGIPFGTHKQWTEGASPGIYVNASKCKINTSTTITCQNYLTIPRYVTSDFEHRADPEDKLNPRDIFIANVMNGNVKDIRLEEVL